jgi:hypothetical protein
VLIVFSKPKGLPVLTCIRDDGTTTYTKSRHVFFGTHDLMHYAVETTLGLRQSFFALVASGWAMTSFDELGSEGDGSRTLPPEAAITEFIVDQLLREQTDGTPLTAAEFNRTLAASLAGAKSPEAQRSAAPKLTDDQLRGIREIYASLLHRYRALAPDARLELPFPRGG